MKKQKAIVNCENVKLYCLPKWYINCIIHQTKGGGSLEIDTVLMERAIINVLSNAVDHSPTHGEIIFNVTKDKGKCKISIIDYRCS